MAEVAARFGRAVLVMWIVTQLIRPKRPPVEYPRRKRFRRGMPG